MLKLKTELEGRTAYFGAAHHMFTSNGYTLCGNWEYDKGSFDGILWREHGETIYIRIPFHTINGLLDDYDAYIQFNTPYVIKHVVNIGLDKDENSLLTATGISQFQEPLDTDGNIRDKSKWEQDGEKAISYIVKTIERLEIS
ncbi:MULTISPECIES: YugN family protein [unclassified Virgibacillus]|uniref:YugN family protein n=1 Tax=unclassified Virgibacillus TaxID=2620237 RepID=UPI0024DF0263|nr:YugN family protein [Virgibacillus sp. LDC-1]